MRTRRFIHALCEPAREETWTAIVSGPDAKKAVAELVAAMYHASLDAYLPYNWSSGFGVFRTDYSNLRSQFDQSTAKVSTNEKADYRYPHMEGAPK